MKWYELREEERIKQVYSKYSIADFWNWWAGDEKYIVMEVRIKDYKLIKEVSQKLKISYSPSGVYVYNAIQLKNVIALTRNKATTWFGINPRKKNWTKRGWRSFGGGDAFVDCIMFMFIDIDRAGKFNRPSNQDELMNCDILSESILETLGKENWNKNYLKICSGNGVQLVIKADVPIKLPNIVFDDKVKEYIENNEFEKIKLVVKRGIGQQIQAFSEKYRKDMKVDVDSSCFFIGKVAALHCTKNYKYGGYTWRGILDMKKGENQGLSDYILSSIDDVKRFESKNMFVVSKVSPKHMMRPGKLMENKLIKFMFNNDLPHGMRNNRLWFSIKILLRDSKIDLKSEEFRRLHKVLEKKYGGSLTMNIPPKKYSFSENTVNNFCIEYKMPLLFELQYPNKKKVDLGLEKIKLDIIKYVDDSFKLRAETTIHQDMNECLEKLKPNNPGNPIIYGSFLKACIKKYGEKDTIYFFDNLFHEFFCYK